MKYQNNKSATHMAMGYMYKSTYRKLLRCIMINAKTPVSGDNSIKNSPSSSHCPIK